MRYARLFRLFTDVKYPIILILVVMCTYIFLNLFAENTKARTIMRKMPDIAKDHDTFPFVEHIWGFRRQHHIDCKALIEGETTEMEKAEKVMKLEPFRRMNDTYFITLTSNCRNFLHQRGYILRPLSTTEEHFPVAYTILMHRNVQQMERLLRTIYRPQNMYCIHVDQKANLAVQKAVKAIAACFPNVFVASKLEEVIYASYSRLQAEINCMKDLLRLNKKWKYYLNLPSQVFPLKTNLELVTILKIYNGANDVEGLANRIIHSRFHYHHVIDRSKKQVVMTNKVKSRPPHNITIVRGSAYGVFSRGFVDYAVNSKVGRDLLEWSKDTLTPDEHFWATLHHLKLNPHLKTPGGHKGDATEKKPWLAAFASWYGRDPCASRRWIHGICIFGIRDLPFLLTRKEIFANKFILDFEPLTYECLEEWIHNKTFSPLPFDTYYYRQLPFIRK